MKTAPKKPTFLYLRPHPAGRVDDIRFPDEDRGAAGPAAIKAPVPVPGVSMGVDDALAAAKTPEVASVQAPRESEPDEIRAFGVQETEGKAPRERVAEEAAEVTKEDSSM